MVPLGWFVRCGACSADPELELVPLLTDGIRSFLTAILTLDEAGADDEEEGPGCLFDEDDEGFTEDKVDTELLLLLSLGFCDSDLDSFSLSESESLSDDSLSLDESLLSLLESLLAAAASLFLLLFDLLFVAALVSAEMSFSVLFLPVPGGLPTFPELGLPRT